MERLQGEVAGLSRRVRELEELFATRRALKADEKYAVEKAARMGLRVDLIFITPGRKREFANPERAEHGRQSACLARALHVADGWSQTRIARAFYCASRTVQLWLGGSQALEARRIGRRKKRTLHGPDTKSTHTNTHDAADAAKPGQTEGDAEAAGPAGADPEGAG